MASMVQRCFAIFFLVVCFAVLQRVNCAVVTDEHYYGVLIGSLDDRHNAGIKGDVYIVNSTTVQVIGFTYSGSKSDLYFWVDTETKLTPTGHKLITFEVGEKPLPKMNKNRVVLWMPPGMNVKDFGSFGIFSIEQSKRYSQLSIHKDLVVPTIQFLDGFHATTAGKRFGLASGPILIMDRRTVKIFGFSFDPTSSPPSYFYVGRGAKPDKEKGKKVPIRGYEPIGGEPRTIYTTYTGDQDIILDLPKGYNVFNIDWLFISPGMLQQNIDYGHVKFGDTHETIPPHVPLQTKYVHKLPDKHVVWSKNVLSGRHVRRFTFQLGPPGYERSYANWTGVEPNRWVWYVNGYMTPQIWLLRGTTYTFAVEGGENFAYSNIENALYISDTKAGGKKRLLDQSLPKPVVYAGLDSDYTPHPDVGTSYGRNCSWVKRHQSSPPADTFQSFRLFKQSLKLTCEHGKSAAFSWTPDDSTPDVVYYNSYAEANMGFEMVIVNRIGDNLVADKDHESHYMETTVEPGRGGHGGRRESISSPRDGHITTTQLNSSSTDRKLSSFWYLCWSLLSVLCLRSVANF